MIFLFWALLAGFYLSVGTFLTDWTFKKTIHKALSSYEALDWCVFVIVSLEWPMSIPVYWAIYFLLRGI
jgi:hypothetical protein